MTDLVALLAPIRERLAAATPGPWEFDGDVVQDVSLAVPTGPNESERVGIIPGEHVRDNDAVFIAHAPSDTARLLAAIDAVTGLCDRAENVRLEYSAAYLARDLRTALTAALGVAIS